MVRAGSYHAAGQRHLATVRDFCVNEERERERKRSEADVGHLFRDRVEGILSYFNESLTKLSNID